MKSLEALNINYKGMSCAVDIAQAFTATFLLAKA